jgi:flagellar basal-body rod protein FlgC
MNLFGMMDVSGSALKAERVRAEVVASNMANAETTRTATGGPYQRQQVVFQQANFADAMQSAGLRSMSPMSPMNSMNSTSADAATGGVEVAGVMADTTAPLQRYDPGHPDADANGFVAYPDINPLTEMVDLMGATRAYGMNASALQAEKGMFSASLDILKT